jgi:hypothetical protein
MTDGFTCCLPVIPIRIRREYGRMGWRMVVSDIIVAPLFTLLIIL